MTVSQALQLAQQHHQAGRLSEAEALFRQILSIAPRHAPALHHLGLIAFQVGKFAPAIECLQEVIALEPTNAAAYSNLGEALRCAGRLEEAATCFHHALALKPDLPEAHLNLGNALGDSGHLEESIVSYQRALAIAPTHARVWCALGTALERQADFAGAERGYRQAIAHSPGLAEAHINLGALLLRRAPGEEGWREYEWRRRFTTPSGRLRALSRKSEWQGEPMPGGTLLIHTEQGLGDSLQFLRYLPLARERAGAAQVILAGQPQLVPLLRQIEGGMVDRVLAVAEDGELPPFDRYLPLLSLPRALGRFAPLPTLEPYLKAEEARRAQWRTRFDSCKARRVGLAWKGNPAHGNDRRRSLPPERLSPLLRRM
jgi:Flp pilus assembly protein TadD